MDGDHVSAAKYIASKYLGISGNAGPSARSSSRALSFSKGMIEAFVHSFAAVTESSPSSSLATLFDPFLKETLDILRANFLDMCARLSTVINDTLTHWRDLQFHLMNVTPRFPDLLHDQVLRKKFVEFLSANFSSDLELYYLSEKIWKIYWKNDPSYDEGEKVIRIFAEKHMYSMVDISGHSKHKLPAELVTAIESFFKLGSSNEGIVRKHVRNLSDSAQAMYTDLYKITSNLFRLKFDLFSAKSMCDKSRSEVFAKELKALKKSQMIEFKQFAHIFYHPIASLTFSRYVRENAGNFVEVLQFYRSVLEFQNRDHLGQRHMMENVSDIRDILVFRKFQESWPSQIDIDAIASEAQKVRSGNHLYSLFLFSILPFFLAYMSENSV